MPYYEEVKDVSRLLSHYKNVKGVSRLVDATL